VGQNNYFGDSNSLKQLGNEIKRGKSSKRSVSDWECIGSYDSQHDEDYSYNEDFTKNRKKVSKPTFRRQLIIWYVV